MGDIFQEIPKSNTRKYQICVNFLKNYPLNSEQYAEYYGIMSFKSLALMRCEFDDMCEEGLLKKYQGSYSPSPRLKNSLKLDEIEYVKPREPKPFTPLSPSRYLPKVSPRGQQLREFCHIGLSNGAKEEERRNDLSVLNEVMSDLQAEQVDNPV